jgi:glycogen debranching enzyme
MKSFHSLHALATEQISRNIIQLDEKSLLQAGSNQFASFWTRDFCFSVPGLLSISRDDVVRDHLSTLLENIHPHTHVIPRLLDTGSGKGRVVAHTVGRIFGLHHLYPQQRTKPLQSEYV